jgi:hypothetical protein
MPIYKVAHIREQGQDLVIVPLESAFGHKPQDEQKRALVEFELHTRAAGLAGHVALVWDSGGRLSSLGPKNWHQFLSSINLNYVMSRVNKQISW